LSPFKKLVVSKNSDSKFKVLKLKLNSSFETATLSSGLELHEAQKIKIRIGSSLKFID
jgi:hypothetical protein